MRWPRYGRGKPYGRGYEQVMNYDYLIETEWSIYSSPSWAIIGSNNNLSPVRRQAIIWTNAVFLSIGPLATNFSAMPNHIIELQYVLSAYF